jgi:AraC-like DNA-binding protein
MCFEYDTPDKRSQGALVEVGAQNATLPIIMLTYKPLGKCEILALRDHVWDHLIKPISVTRFCECLTGLTRPIVTAAQPSASPMAAPAPTPKTLTDTSLSPAMSYVAKNYAEKLRLSTAAKLCDLSRFQFSRNFKKERGLTFRDFVVQVRIQRAAELMRQSRTLSVTEAAFVVGFNDLSHFSRMFRRQLGVSPSHYRRAQSEPCQLPLFAPAETRKQ